MSTDVKQSQYSQDGHKRNHLDPADYEELMRWRLIFALLIIYILLSLAGLIGYGVTRDTHFLWFITPTALVPFLRLLVPMDKRKYELQLEQIRVDGEFVSTQRELHEAQARLRQLEARLRKQQERLPSH